MPRVTDQDLKKLGDICNRVCYHLTAHLAAVARGSTATNSDVAKLYQLADSLPAPTLQDYAALTGVPVKASKGASAGSAPAAGPMADGAERAPGKRLKWTLELETELIRLVEDEELRREKLGKDAQRAGTLNWAAIARHFGYGNGGGAVKAKYYELKGLPKPAGKSRKKKGGEEEEEEEGGEEADEKPPAKKAKATQEPASAAKAGGTPATGAGGEWSKKDGQDLVKLVEEEEERKKVFGKKKLKWKSIARQLGKHKKDCRKHYTKLTGKEAPEGDEE